MGSIHETEKQIEKRKTEMNKNTLLIAEYEQQLRNNPQDIDVRWKLVQARYEIVTVGNRLLLGRMNMPRIYTDRDARLVLEGMQGEARDKFLEQIRMLAASQEAVEKVKDTDAVCDVYLAFDESSKEDASIARDIYYGLSAKGISVYYEPEKTQVGELDAHRLFALQHAKVLILVGTSVDCMQKEATAGAWMRYLNRMERDSHIHILPAYKNMNPKDFPGGLSKIQGIDVGRIGAIQAFLIPRVQELIGGHDQVIIVKKSDGKQVNISNVLSRIEFMLEDGDFELAHDRLEKFAEDYGTDYEQFHYLRLLEQAKARNQKELAYAINESLIASSDYQYLMEKGSKNMKEDLLQLEEMKVKYQKEELEETYVEKIRKEHINGDYEAVLKLVEEVKTMSQFSRWADVQAYYQAAITRVENKKIYDEFRELVGNGKDFYMNQLKKKEPGKYQILKKHGAAGPISKTITQKTLIGLLCLISLLVCRLHPNVDVKSNSLTVGFVICVAYSIVTRIRRDGFLLAILKGGGMTVVIPCVIGVLLVSTGLARNVDTPLGFLVKLSGLLTGFPVMDANGYTYAMDYFSLIVICCLPIIVFMIKGIKYGKMLYKITSEQHQQEKEYQQLVSSGFLTQFQQKEYEELVERYRKAVGDRWIEPKKIWN